MTPQPWFVVAGLLFILAVIAGALLLVLVALVVLRGATFAVTLDDHRQDEPQPADPGVVLAQLLADLAAHQQRQQAGWEQSPVIDLTPPPGSTSRPGGRR